MKLMPVYDLLTDSREPNQIVSDYFLLTLFDLLAERKPHQNISHQRMPSYEEHCQFVNSMPYKAWYLIEEKDEILGTVYLTKQNEIGIQLFDKYRGKGFGTMAIVEIMKFHKGPFYANINPKNEDSIRFFEGFGAKHIQNTYIFNE